ncbi:MAG: putative rane protein [Pseudomonadota bacterium]|nr:putative rane protein [Pseudomonadota bacterium]MDQ5903423.1 putative rane protein [Pseudomonadota bacterium]
MLNHFLTAVPSFFAYFGVAIVLIAVFLLVYVNVTPYEEVALIRAGNSAAAVSLSGALFGFVMPVANAIAHSESLADLAAWGGVAGIVQILAYLAARFAFPQMNSDIPAGKVAPAIFLAVLSLSVGLVSAACMSY